MACSLLTCIFPLRHRSGHRQVTPSIANRSTSTIPVATKRAFSWDRLRAYQESKMHPDPLVSVCLYGIPIWLSQQLIEGFIKDIPRLVQIRRRTQNKNAQDYDLLLDFEAGTNPLKALNITEEEPFVAIEHYNFRVYPQTDILTCGSIDVVGKLKPQHSGLDHSEGTTTSKALELKDLGTHKPQCCICCSEIDGPFGTPCWGCRRAQCHDCIRQHFRTSLKDFECFPARCCQIVIHPDVAKDILPNDELAKYKLRFEEWITQHPVYCPAPTCSTFIPPRLLKQVEGNQFNCHACHTPICMSCKLMAHIGQPCGQPEHEILKMHKDFGYKQCPRCRMAVAKMYGCSHVRCNCGAHWCWDCRRKIDVCNISPCRRENAAHGYENDMGMVSDIDDEDISDDEVSSTGSEQNDNLNTEDVGDISSSAPEVTTAEAQMSTSSNPTTSEHNVATDFQQVEFGGDHDFPSTPGLDVEYMESLATLALQQEASAQESRLAGVPTSTVPSPRLVPATTDSPNPPKADVENLDDPNETHWEAELVDFGSDPDEDDTLDIWGCMHEFRPVFWNMVPRYWMTASVPDWWERNVEDRRMSCMACSAEVRVALKKSETSKLEIEDKKAHERLSRDWRIARRCIRCGVMVCRRCRNDMFKKDEV